MRPPRPRLVALAFALATLVACSVGKGVGGPAGGVAPSACHTCLDNQCPAQESPCTTAACEAFEICATACTDAGCVQSCLQKSSDPAASNLADCLYASCGSCLTGPASSACVVAAADPPCSACFKQQCCAQLEACNADAICVSTQLACASCPNTSCLATCAQQSGNTGAINLAACANTACGTCG